MKFSLIHPSRNRPEMAEQALMEWTNKLSGENPYEYLLSIDDDERDKDAYSEVARRFGGRLIVHDNRSYVEAVNHAARLCDGDFLIVVSDDFGCPERWDVSLVEVAADRKDVAILVHDAVDGRIMTLPIVGRAFYERLGYVFYPEYSSLFCDDELTEVAKLTGSLVDATHLVFPHRHHSVGQTPFDKTYERQDSNRAWWEGWRLFEKRKAVGFGLRARSPAALATQIRIELEFQTRTWGSRVKKLFGLSRAQREGPR